MSSIERLADMTKPESLDLSHPGAAINFYDGILAGGVEDYLQYEAHYPPRGTVLLPGELQTDGYAREAVDWKALGIPADAREFSIQARLQRLALLGANGQGPFEFVIHEDALRRPGNVSAATFAAALTHVYQVTTDRSIDVRVRLLTVDAIAGDGRLLDVEPFRAFVTRPTGVPLLVTKDLERYDLPGRGKFERLGRWRQALGELALDWPESADRILSAAA